MTTPCCLKISVLVCLLASLASAREDQPLPGSKAEKKSSTRGGLLSARLTQKVAAAFPAFDPSQVNTPVVKEEAPPEKSDVVVLDPFIVTDEWEELMGRKMMTRFAEDKEKAVQEAFHWKKGGTLIERGPVKLQIKYNPERGGFDLLSMKW